MAAIRCPDCGASETGRGRLSHCGTSLQRVRCEPCKQKRSDESIRIGKCSYCDVALSYNRKERRYYCDGCDRFFYEQGAHR
jgi:hypothetical protein